MSNIFLKQTNPRSHVKDVASHPTKVFAWSWSTVDHLRSHEEKPRFFETNYGFGVQPPLRIRFQNAQFCVHAAVAGIEFCSRRSGKALAVSVGKNETRLNQFLNSCGDYQTKLICINTHSSWIFNITRRCHLHCSTNGAEGNVWLFIFGGWLRDAKGTTIHWALFLFALAPVLPSNRAPSFCHGMPTKSPQIWSPDSSGRGPIGRSTWHGQCLEIFEIIRALQGTSVTPNRDRVRPDGGANDASKGGPFQKMINFSSRKLPNGPPCPSSKGIDGHHGGWFESALKHLSYPYIQPFDM